MTTFIVGSKPEAIFPNAEPDGIVAANGAITRVQDYVGKCKIIGMVSSLIFTDANENCTLTREVLHDCYVDNLVIRDSVSVQELAVHPSEVLHYQECTHLSTRYDVLSTIRLIGLRHLVNYVHDLGGVAAVAKLPFQFLRRGMIPFLKPSTGMVALSLAIQWPDFSPPYYVVGIGLDPTSTHHYNSRAVYGAAHLHADTLVAKAVSTNSLGEEVVFTDPSFQRIYS